MLKSTLLLASAAIVTAQSSSSSEPCALAADALGEGSGYIEAQIAFDCLDSVPVDVEGNTQFIDELKQVWQFQSEINWLKNPGDDWEFGPLDVEKELDNIKSNLGSFSSEYTVQLAIQNITIRSGNFHWNYRPDILQVFQFSRPVNVASISSDGKSLPKLYIFDDVEALAENSSDVSEISKINGQDPYEFLLANSWSQYIDSDGLINAMVAKGDTDHLGAFAAQKKFDGNSTDFTFGNGTEASISNLAQSDYSFRNVVDGKSFFSRFCTGAVSGLSSSANTKAGSASPDAPNPDLLKRPGFMINHVVSPGAPGPVPVIRPGVYHRRAKRQTISSTSAYASAVAEASSGVVAGYFLNGDGYEDVAVLKIISFSNPDETEESTFNDDFQSTVTDFLDECISQNKQKLILDLRENGGGTTGLLLDAFMQLFPDMEPFSGQRYRATSAFLKIGSAVDEIRNSPSKARVYKTYAQEDIQENFLYRYWSWWQFRNAEGTDFNGWDDFNGPFDNNDDSYTATFRYNYTNEVSVRPEGFTFSTRRTAPFNASNIVMYTDALCGSSCASFHEELKNIAGVRAVTVGGRPENKPIQTVTGSKGGEVTPLLTWPTYATLALNFSTLVGLSAFKDNDKTLSGIANVPHVLTRTGDGFSRLQSQDQIRKGDKSATPLQYVYEASDCKIFYTADSFADPDAAWKQAWDAFQDKGKCVEGSTGHKSSLSGGFKAFGPGELKKEDEPERSEGDGNGSGGDDDKEDAAANVRVSSMLVGVAAVVMGAMML